ncbi:hypothetical protein [Companilactobacillus mishanensis]|uniref:Uncharacterized protein n=1 Tax=Companilactobacillus mishanensis TaxID=2486008 RepID=A0A5P0ZEI0_9LACO|nr:hypothetical protein [Companilactobacillus mishanensis]MQS44446.1 hypothetical protein [Companilactobacillus mishanensis]MQS51450.1 hypothetical protein [Companilactobacillus mishanensis]MQS88689.1 hypothetical protein [Companilactobacillus mishanensis]
MKRKYLYFITITFIVIDLVFSVLTKLGIVDNLVGMIVGAVLIVALYVIIRTITRVNWRRGRLAISLLSAVFIFLSVLPLVTTQIVV